MKLTNENGAEDRIFTFECGGLTPPCGRRPGAAQLFLYLDCGLVNELLLKKTLAGVGLPAGKDGGRSAAKIDRVKVEDDFD